MPWVPWSWKSRDDHPSWWQIRSKDSEDLNQKDWSKPPRSWVVLEGILPLGDEGCSYLISNKANQAICKPLYQATWDVRLHHFFDISESPNPPGWSMFSSFFPLLIFPKVWSLRPLPRASRVWNKGGPSVDSMLTEMVLVVDLEVCKTRWVKLINGT